MAEPLSIASGIAGLLSLGIQVTQSLITFYSAYKDRDNDLAKIIRNSEGLQRIFQSLETAVQARQSQPDAYELLKEVDEAVQGCREIIEELEKECRKFHKDPDSSWKSHIQVAGRRAAYPFRKSTLQKLQEDINEIHRNLSSALDVLQLKSHNQTQYDISELKSELKSFLERINMSQISSAIRGWLNAPDASIDHDITCAKRHSSTGLWFINGHHFTNWLVQRNSFLWINGFAGCGKSVLCSTAIQHTFHEMKDKHGVGIAFFYFSFRDEAKQDSHGMLRALLSQLSVQLPDGEKDLEQLYMLHGQGTPPVRVLLDSLQNVLGRFYEVFILLDALDESPQDHKREDVLREIETIREWNLPGLHLLVTSRNELDINESLDPSDGETLTTKNPGVDSDIATFVSDQLKDDQKLQRWENYHYDIKEQLTQRAQGVFRYVECQLKELRRAKTPNQLNLLLRSLPRDLDETYERILSNIEELYVDDVRRILTVLCVSTRPVTTDELGHAVAVDLSAEKLDCDRLYERNDLIYICHGLVEIAETDNDDEEEVFIARIAHFSVQEYLQSKRILQHPQPKANRFSIQSEPANTEIALICIVYLLEPMLSSGILDKAKVREFPLAHFAAEHWYHHYMNSHQGKPKVEELLQRLFQGDTNHFVTWVRLFNVEHMDFPQLARKYAAPIDYIQSPLYYASFLGLEFILSSIIAFSARNTNLLEMVNAQGGLYGNALQAASLKGHENIVQMLLNQGADVNAQGGRYGNALQAASSDGHEKIVQMLLDQGADVNAQGGWYGNALQAASLNGYEKVVKVLLGQGANVNIHNRE